MEQAEIRELISEEAVDKRIKEMGAQISKDYAGERSTFDRDLKRRRLFCV